MSEIVNRHGRLRNDADVSTAAYPPEDGERDWQFQLSFLAGNATSVIFSGIERGDMEALRDHIDEVLAGALPRTEAPNTNEETNDV